MPWYGFAALAAVIVGGIPFAVDYVRRRGFPRLPRVRFPGFRRGSADIPGEFSLRLAKTIVGGEFKKSPFKKKPFVDLFPTKSDCPHCGGHERKAWSLARAEKLLGDVAELARQISRKKFCLGCLEQLTDIAKMRKEHLQALGEKDPQSLSPSVPKRVVVSLSLGAVFFPPLLILLTLIIAVRKRGVYWLPFILTTSFFLSLVVLGLAVWGLPLR